LAPWTKRTETTCTPLKIALPSDVDHPNYKLAKAAVPPTQHPNTSKRCWGECNKTPGACSWCGTGGKCCRLGYKDGQNGCALDEGVDRDHHTCVQGMGSEVELRYLSMAEAEIACQTFESSISETCAGIYNEQCHDARSRPRPEGCWDKCGEKSGTCSWCDAGATIGASKCCRQGFGGGQPLNDCLVSEGGVGKHSCVHPTSVWSLCSSKTKSGKEHGGCNCFKCNGDAFPSANSCGPKHSGCNGAQPGGASGCFTTAAASCKCATGLTPTGQSNVTPTSCIYGRPGAWTKAP